jgi:hypothetical protein
MAEIEGSDITGFYAVNEDNKRKELKFSLCLIKHQTKGKS